MGKLLVWDNAGSLRISKAIEKNSRQNQSYIASINELLALIVFGNISIPSFKSRNDIQKEVVFKLQSFDATTTRGEIT